MPGSCATLGDFSFTAEYVLKINKWTLASYEIQTQPQQNDRNGRGFANRKPSMMAGGQFCLRIFTTTPIGGLAPLPHGVARLDQKLRQLRTHVVRPSDVESTHVKTFDEPVGGERHDSDPDQQFLSSAAA
jgi:hypothetical protein